MGVLLEAKELSKSYASGPNDGQQVLKKVNLQIRKGEFIAVMGPSGSGKSTLLFNLSGMDRASSGSVTFGGEDICSFSEKRLSELRLTKMGFIFQHIHLLKNLSLLDNIVLSAYLAKRSSRKSINARALEYMRKSGIDELAGKSITQASGGQLQRVAICRALINQPEIVFGDEPTGALNSKSAGEIMDLLADINEAGTTILLVTHDVKVAAKTERILFMLDGSLVAERNLGKYRKGKGDVKAREEDLAGWLANLGL
ncbi:ABC transporter ATP-binding protein [Cohnella sp. CIP 111063]|uniref:ABC transporter ATP-binding protein n=1 Tax=unclassified Cohnella TaxID=2636738 RepID=UPI000B8BFC4D|nr:MULTISPECIES: ABC transporter ATP-binding protein [unclassified Cohnella]OXS62724.1 ABC transporter ATP-binding protein [Cohnella sp. CIP 111063]PRX74996.1 putative ABC transport system ATP-binding protein [Cohnella sp. SGD-V74]